MLVFNCTKAALDFFTFTRKGEKLTCVKKAPHKTIAEDLILAGKHSGEQNYQWHWLVHCVSIQRKKYLLVMDHHSRYCLAFRAGKKGDEIEFLNTFEMYLKANFMAIVNENHLDAVEVDVALNAYNREINDCAFYLRGDRSMQGHINEIDWLLNRHTAENGELKEDVDFLGFNLHCSQIPRRTKGLQDYFYANERFVEYWTSTFNDDHIEFDENKVINLSDYINKV